MYSVLDFMGAVIYLILNIIIFPLVVLVNAIIYSWILQKFLTAKSQILISKIKHHPFTERMMEKRGFGFARSRQIEITH